MPKARETPSDETEQWPEQNSHMAQKSETSQREFQATTVNMLMTLMEKVNYMPGQMGNVSGLLEV